MAPVIEEGRTLRTSLREGLDFFEDLLLSSYSQILFTSNKKTGLLLMAATAVKPLWFLAGLCSVFLSGAFAFLLGMDRNQIRQGIFGYNALLLGLASVSFLEPSPSLLLLWALSILAVVLITAALNTLLRYYFNLPVLSLPFLLGVFLILAAYPHMRELGPASHSIPSLTEGSFLHFNVTVYLRSLGAIFFLPNLLSGLLVLLALLVFSRIGFILSLIGFVIGIVISKSFFSFPPESLYLLLGFNFILTSLALGGIWFIPRFDAVLLAAGGSLLCGLFAAASVSLLYPVGLPVLVLPFILTMYVVLYGMRQRTKNRHPEAVTLNYESPEANLRVYSIHSQRFGPYFPLRFQLPFDGVWTCTQGVNGQETHRGLWRDAWDFEIEDPLEGKFRESGLRTSDYRCYHQLVKAPRGGTVMRVVDGIPNNLIGEVNLEDPWGNCVILGHGSGLFTAMCHLSPGTITVREGDIVRMGDHLGLCGNSGRSPVPHLHFQFQVSAQVGAPTLTGRFHEVIVENTIPSFRMYISPRVLDRVRNLQPNEDLPTPLRFGIGQELTFQLRAESQTKCEEERVVCETDLYGNLVLVSSHKKARLYIDTHNALYTALNFQGRDDSVLFLLYLALPCLPLDRNTGIVWEDYLSSRSLMSFSRRILHDFAAMFSSSSQYLTMEYHMNDSSPLVKVNGQLKAGSHAVKTEAIISGEEGIEELVVHTDKGRFMARRKQLEN